MSICKIAALLAQIQSQLVLLLLLNGLKQGQPQVGRLRIKFDNINKYLFLCMNLQVYYNTNTIQCLYKFL